MFFSGEGDGAVFSYGAPGKERGIPVSGVSGKGGLRAGGRPLFRGNIPASAGMCLQSA